MKTMKKLFTFCTITLLSCSNHQKEAELSEASDTASFESPCDNKLSKEDSLNNAAEMRLEFEMKVNKGKIWHLEGIDSTRIIIKKYKDTKGKYHLYASTDYETFITDIEVPESLVNEVNEFDRLKGN